MVTLWNIWLYHVQKRGREVVLHAGPFWEARAESEKMAKAEGDKAKIAKAEG
jgi:hypothetical protein